MTVTWSNVAREKGERERKRERERREREREKGERDRKESFYIRALTGNREAIEAKKKDFEHPRKKKNKKKGKKGMKKNEEK